MDGIEKAFVLLIFAIVAVLIINLLVSVNYQSQAQGTINLQNSNPGAVSIASTVSSLAQNDVAFNALKITCTGSCNFLINNQTTYYVAGTAISAYATNVVLATQGGAENQSFTATVASWPYTLTSTTGNYYSINSVAFSIAGHTYQSYPSITLSVSQSFNAVSHNSAPAIYATNTITGQSVYTITPAGVVSNYTLVAGGINNTVGLNLGYVIGLLFLIIIIVALLWGIRSGKFGSVMGGIAG